MVKYGLATYSIEVNEIETNAYDTLEDLGIHIKLCEQNEMTYHVFVIDGDTIKDFNEWGKL